MKQLIRSASLTNFPEVAREVGLNPARLLAKFDLSQRCLRDPELKVPAESVRRLLEAAADRSKVEAFGLMMAETRRLSDLGPVGLLIREQPTRRHALKTAARYARKLNVALSLTVEEVADVVVMREELVVGYGGSVRQMTELAIGVAFRMLRSFLGPSWKPLRVCFAHEAPGDRSTHQRVFACKVEFDHDFNGIVCARRDLDAVNPNADPAKARYARQLVDSSLHTEAWDTTNQVRGLVLTLLGTGRCTIDLVAQHLGSNRRTVQRRLAAEGQQFSKIVASVRRELAERYMQNSKRTSAEISSLLAFAAPSGFRRWYRRQSGRPPSRKAR